MVRISFREDILSSFFLVEIDGIKPFSLVPYRVAFVKKRSILVFLSLMIFCYIGVYIINDLVCCFSYRLMGCVGVESGEKNLENFYGIRWSLGMFLIYLDWVVQTVGGEW